MPSNSVAKFCQKVLNFTLYLICIQHYSIRFASASNSDVIQLNPQNAKSVIESGGVVMVNFYADWCHFSRLLAPIWVELASKVGEINSNVNQSSSIVIAKVDCDAHSSLAGEYKISKYPTIKYFQNGVEAKKEYRGKRNVEAMFQFIQSLQVEYSTKFDEDVQNHINSLDKSKTHILGTFSSQSSVEYVNFQKVATAFHEQCEFHHSIQSVQLPPNVISIDSKSTANNIPSQFTGNLQIYADLQAWVSPLCTNVVRQVTFENAEELTEEGLPFVILFHPPTDQDFYQKEYKTFIEKYFSHALTSFNFLTADGHVFAHPLHHLGKSKTDLPVIAMDSFRHMYIYPNHIKASSESAAKGSDDIIDRAHFQHFLDGYSSGRLHREFHYGPEETEENNDNKNNVQQGTTGQGNKPPKSQFQRLKPQRSRYTLLQRDEL